MSISSKLSEILTPIVNDIGTLPFILSNVSGPEGTLFSSSTTNKGPESELIAVYSTTKPITTLCVLQLYDKGLLDLEDDVEKWIPELAYVPLLSGWDDETDEPVFTKPENTMKIKHLITHTSGFAYPNLFKNYYKWFTRTKGFDPAGLIWLQPTWAEFKSHPLVFEPGTSFSYGMSVDWAGKVVESVSGLDLDTYMKENIFSKLEMNDTTFRRSDKQVENTLPYYTRQKDSADLLDVSHIHPQSPEMSCGGQGLFSTVDDLSKFFRMILNDGTSPTGEIILSSSTLEKYVLNNVLPEGMELPTEVQEGAPAQNAPTKMYPPEVRVSWTCNFLKNEDPSPTGKSAGSLSWGGLPHILFWIDPIKKISAVWSTQLLPTGDMEAVMAYLAFEKGVYDVINES